MSTPSLNYTLFYPETNTITALSLTDGLGATLTPASVTDVASPPIGWKAKSLEFAAPVEAVFVAPTFQNANAPVPVYLTYPVTGPDADINVLDYTILFNPMAPLRPTPRPDMRINYTAETGEDLSLKRWVIKEPLDFLPKVKRRSKDLVTGLPLTGNDFLLLWRGVLPDCIEVQCDVEDITDPAGFFSIPVSNITSYAESSVGLSLVKAQSEIIPQDGFEHALRFRIRYNCAGDVSGWVTSDWKAATYILPAPNQPLSVAVNVLRDRNDVVPDRVQIDWQWAVVNPGDAVEVYAIDFMGKRHLIGEETDNSVTRITVENVTRFWQVDRPPATQTAYKFGVLAKNRTSKSDLTLTITPVLLTSKIRDSAPQTPDEIAGTAGTVDGPYFPSRVAATVGQLPDLTDEQRASLSSLSYYAVLAVINTIKDVVMKGGSVTVSNFGEFRAKWVPERSARVPATGEIITVPAYRSNAFTPSVGYKVGTKTGQILTDAQGKAAGG